MFNSAKTRACIKEEGNVSHILYDIAALNGNYLRKRIARHAWVVAAQAG